MDWRKYPNDLALILNDNSVTFNSYWIAVQNYTLPTSNFDEISSMDLLHFYLIKSSEKKIMQSSIKRSFFQMQQQFSLSSILLIS